MENPAPNAHIPELRGNIQITDSPRGMDAKSAHHNRVFKYAVVSLLVKVTGIIKIILPVYMNVPGFIAKEPQMSPPGYN